MVAIVFRSFPTRVPQQFLYPVKTLLPATPWIIVISAVAATPQFDPTLFSVWLGIHAVTLFAAGFVGLGVSALIRQSGKASVSVGWVIAVGAVVGGAKALGTIAVEDALGLADAPLEAILARAIGGVVVGMWLITIVALGRTVLESVEQARDAVIRQNVATRLSEEEQAPSTEVSQSLAAISRLRQDIATSQASVGPMEIRAVVDATIRPLSRALWAVENKRYPEIRFTALYRIALQTFKTRAWLIALVWSATTFTALGAPTGILHAATYAATVGGVAWAVFSVVRLGWTESIAMSLAVVGLGSIGTVVLGYAVTGLLMSTPPQAQDLVIIASGVVWMVFVVLGSSVVSGVLRLREVIRRDLDATGTQDLIRQRATDDTATASTKRLATRLHGSVQSGLLGIAAALDRGTITAPEVDKTLAGIARELELLGQTEAGSHHSAENHPDKTLASLFDQWRGILDITIDEHTLKHLGHLLRSRPEIVDIVREALTNAHRHGRASQVAITATPDDSGDITLSVTDNGYGPTDGTPGLGSTLLDAWTQTRWSLTQAAEGGSHLVATISATRPASSVEGM